MSFEIEFFGHENVRSLHQRTIEVTCAGELGVAGDCIVGVRASSGCRGIPEDVKGLLRDPRSRVEITIRVGQLVFRASARGHGDLELGDPHDMVIRRSSFVCPRTLAVCCDAASDSLPREMVRMLQDPAQKGTLRIDVQGPK